MTAIQKRVAIWGSVGLLIAIGLLSAFWPRALQVDVAVVRTGPMMSTVDGEGEARVIDVFVLSSPITGRLRRIEAEPGDDVVASETVVAEIEPAEPDLLDPRSEAEAEAQLKAAESAEALASAEFEKVKAEFEFARSELDRARELAKDGTIPARDLESAARTFETSRAAIDVAQANLQVRAYELVRARARLMSPEEMRTARHACECVDVTSPVDGQILRILRESEGFVRAGEGLAEIGDPGRMEIVIDMLSVDAVKVEPGHRALIENWGSDRTLQARVRRVEPFGFTKVSALGIEEQRVNVVLDIVSPRDEWRRLGHGYQVDVRVVLLEDDRALKVPLTALFRSGDKWAVFAVEDGLATQRVVAVGQRTVGEAQILSGLVDGDSIIVYPSESIDEGVRVLAR